MIQEVDYIELPAKEEPSRPAFEREKIESSTFTTTAWFLSNFGKIAHHVWWGYKVTLQKSCSPWPCRRCRQRQRYY